MTENAFKRWESYYRSGSRSWPSETLVRLLRGSYIPGLDRNHAGKSVLDVGFGDGGNLVFLGSLGLALHGVEVDQGICDLVTERLTEAGLAADLRVGTNDRLPFEDDRFDLLVSWNVVHYVDNEAALRRNLAEYARVLKPGGRLVLASLGPDDTLPRTATLVGPHRYRIELEGDLRKGQVFYYFDHERYVEHYLSERFTGIRVGRQRDDLFTHVVDQFIATAVKAG